MRSSVPVRLDLHTFKTGQALSLFQQAYKLQIASGAARPIEVIHGYGSSGEGGIIRTRLRAYLKANAAHLDFRTGEQIDGNPGYTLVYPRHPLPDEKNSLQEEILRYCTTPRSEEKIAGKFRRYGEPAVKDSLKLLQQQGSLTALYKGGYKCYQVSK